MKKKMNREIKIEFVYPKGREVKTKEDMGKLLRDSYNKAIKRYNKTRMEHEDDISKDEI